MKRSTKILIGVVGTLAAIQVVQLERTNPPVAVDREIVPPDDVKAVLKRACYDCHSHETVWPWYSRVAPASWLVHRDVVDGRGHLNFSEWGLLPPEKRIRKLTGIGREVGSGDMPPWFYLPLHSHARLSEADKQLLQRWVEAQKAKEPAIEPGKEPAK